jgi:hypothetical protein
MYIVVDLERAGVVELREQDDFRGFKVVVEGAGRGDGALAQSLEPHGWMDTDGHAFLRVEAVKALAGARARDPAWIEQFDAMVEFAGRHGWLDDRGEAIRAHCERAGAQP